MTIALWCVLIAAVLPFAFAGAAKFGGSGGYNNRKPREFLEKLEGWRKRAHWAQLNSFESFPPFAAAVIIAQMLHAPQNQINGLAVAFIVLRVLYGVAYLADKQALRSLIWTAAFGCVIGLFIVAA